MDSALCEDELAGASWAYGQAVHALTDQQAGTAAPLRCHYHAVAAEHSGFWYVVNWC